MTYESDKNRPRVRSSAHKASFRRVATDNLVIYTSEPTVKLRAERLIDPNELVTELTDKMDPGAAAGSDLGAAAGAGPEVAPGATKEVPLASCDNSGWAVAEKLNEKAGDAVEKIAEKAAEVAKEYLKKPTIDFQVCWGEAKCLSLKVNAPPTSSDAPPKTGTRDLAEPDSAVNSNSAAEEKFDKVMSEFLVTSFSDGAAAASYFQEKLKEEGLEVKVTENGYEVSLDLEDPFGVADSLRRRGISDRATIDGAVSEANYGLRSVEEFFEGVQSNLRAEYPTREAAVDAVLGADGSSFEDPFARLAAGWMDLVPEGFTAQLGHGSMRRRGGMATSTPQSAPSQPASASSPANAPSGQRPADLLSIEMQTPIGVMIQAQISTRVEERVNPGNVEPGVVYVPRLQSVFDNPDDWARFA